MTKLTVVVIEKKLIVRQMNPNGTGKVVATLFAKPKTASTAQFVNKLNAFTSILATKLEGFTHAWGSGSTEAAKCYWKFTDNRPPEFKITSKQGYPISFSPYAYHTVFAEALKQLFARTAVVEWVAKQMEPATLRAAKFTDFELY